jgi:hypothetical protein
MYIDTRCGFAGNFLFVTVATLAGQAWAQYPTGPQITKDGTSVLLQDYASLPLSSLNEASIDFFGPVGPGELLAVGAGECSPLVISLLRERPKPQSLHTR